MRIFISIASYRDPELIPTVQDCLAKARCPERLRFGICWQHGEEESTLPFLGDMRFRVLDVPWHASRGACWARSAVMGLYEGEDYFLQIDSHHRFVDGWDELLLEQLARAASPKPLLTAYPPAFNPADPSAFGTEPMQIELDKFSPDGIPLLKPRPIADWHTRTHPLRARFVGAGFLFAAGEFVREVPYDPDLYFLGEEITLAVRAFTCGYDLFHPNQIILWHEYTRESQQHKHWTDHVDGRVAVAWHERDRASLSRAQRFLEAPHVGPLGLGTARSFADYEAYAGLSFRHRRAQDYTRASLEPPNPPAAPDWAEQTRSYAVDITVDRRALPADDCAFWFVGFHDEQGREIFRLDADRAEMTRSLESQDGPWLTIRRSFESQSTPVKWIIWPHSRSGEWLDRLEGEIAIRADAAPVVEMAHNG